MKKWVSTLILFLMVLRINPALSNVEVTLIEEQETAHFYPAIKVTKITYESVIFESCIAENDCRLIGEPAGYPIDIFEFNENLNRSLALISGGVMVYLTVKPMTQVASFIGQILFEGSREVQTLVLVVNMLGLAAASEIVRRTFLNAQTQDQLEGLSGDASLVADGYVLFSVRKKEHVLLPFGDEFKAERQDKVESRRLENARDRVEKILLGTTIDLARP